MSWERRDFITLLGGAAATWPLAARAQQPLPVVGTLYGVSAALWAGNMAEFRRGLAETGFEEGRNVIIESRWAEGHFEQMPALVTDLVSHELVDGDVAVWSGCPPWRPISSAARSR